jgi:hypothetical protein
MQRLHLVAAEPPATDVSPADIEHALEVLGAAPAGSDSDEALLLVEVMNARAARMAPGSHLRATLVRCVSALARCHGRRHLSPVRLPVERPGGTSFNVSGSAITGWPCWSQRSTVCSQIRRGSTSTAWA